MPPETTDISEMSETIDIIEIEVIESPGSRPARMARPSRPSGAHRPLRRRHVTASVAAVALLAIALVVWQPWRPQPPEWRTYPVATRFPPSLSGRLVFDEPPGDVFQASLPESPLATAVTRSTLIGHVFAQPGSTMRNGAWLSFSTLPSYSPAEPPTSTLVIRGTDATLDRADGRVTVEWGPVDRRSWEASGGGVDDAELLAFADAVGVVDDQPAVRGSYDLSGMAPLGGIEGLRTVLAVERELAQLEPVASVKPTVLRYQDGGVALTLLSVPAAPDTMSFVPFVLGDGGAVEEIAVRGNPGVALSTVGGDNVVSWMEGGRLVVVSGSQPLDELLGWAGSTRAATDEEWRAVANTLMQTVQMIAEGVEVGAGVTPNGNAWRMVVSPFSDFTAFCLVTVNGEQCTMTTGMERPRLDDWYVEGGRVALRFSTPYEPVIARITALDGTVTEVPFVAIDETRTAVAVYVANTSTLEIAPI
jgi:hypothetical protein